MAIDNDKPKIQIKQVFNDTLIPFDRERPFSIKKEILNDDIKEFKKNINKNTKDFKYHIEIKETTYEGIEFIIEILKILSLTNKKVNKISPKIKNINERKETCFDGKVIDIKDIIVEYDIEPGTPITILNGSTDLQKN